MQRVRVQGDSLSATVTVHSRTKSRISGRWGSTPAAGRGGGNDVTGGTLAHSTHPVCRTSECRGQIRFSAPFAARTRPSSLRPPTPPATAASKLRGEHDTPKDPNLTALPAQPRKFTTLKKASRPQRARIQRAFPIWGEERKLHYNFHAGNWKG